MGESAILRREIAAKDARIAELEDYEQLVRLQHRRERDAIATWRAEKPGRELTLPDYGKFMLWLLDERERHLACIADLEAQLRALGLTPERGR